MIHAKLSKKNRYSRKLFKRKSYIGFSGIDRLLREHDEMINQKRHKKWRSKKHHLNQHVKKIVQEEEIIIIDDDNDEVQEDDIEYGMSPEEIELMDKEIQEYII